MLLNGPLLLQFRYLSSIVGKNLQQMTKGQFKQNSALKAL